MLVHDDYATYCTLKLSAKVLSVPNPRKAVGKLLHRGDLDPNLALYCAYWFKQYACNPRAIYEKAAELAPQLRGVWVIDADHVAAIPEGVEYVVAGSPAYEKLVGRATYFISNMNLPKELEKRDGQIHIQTQHGTPLKSMGTDLRHYPVAAKDLDLDELMRQVDRWDYNLSVEPVLLGDLGAHLSGALRGPRVRLPPQRPAGQRDHGRRPGDPGVVRVRRLPPGRDLRADLPRRRRLDPDSDRPGRSRRRRDPPGPGPAGLGGRGSRAGAGPDALLAVEAPGGTAPTGWSTHRTIRGSRT